jgi:hypothetical protein
MSVKVRNKILTTAATALTLKLKLLHKTPRRTAITCVALAVSIGSVLLATPAQASQYAAHQLTVHTRYADKISLCPGRQKPTPRLRLRPVDQDAERLDQDHRLVVVRNRRSQRVCPYALGRRLENHLLQLRPQPIQRIRRLLRLVGSHKHARGVTRCQRPALRRSRGPLRTASCSERSK